MIKLDGFRAVFPDTPAVFITEAEVAESGNVTTVNGFLIQPGGTRHVRLDTVTVLVTRAEETQRAGVLLVRREAEPAESLPVVRFDADAYVVAEAQIALGRRVTAFGGGAVFLSGPDGVLVHPVAHFVTESQ